MPQTAGVLAMALPCPCRREGEREHAKKPGKSQNEESEPAVESRLIRSLMQRFFFDTAVREVL
jgi:hypothetical protein